jgi:hypothetical protein
MSIKVHTICNRVLIVGIPPQIGDPDVICRGIGTTRGFTHNGDPYKEWKVSAICHASPRNLTTQDLLNCTPTNLLPPQLQQQHLLTSTTKTKRSGCHVRFLVRFHVL